MYDPYLKLAYYMGYKLAMRNANELQAAAMKATLSTADLKDKSEDDSVSNSVTRNLKEHNKHVSGNEYGDPIELSEGIDATYMN
jgi:hypothetical protein